MIQMRIDSTRLVSIKSELLEQLKNLEVGDTLKGRVLEALGSSIAVRTASGQVFMAQLPEGVSIPRGSFVELTISSLADGKIFAEFKSESRDIDLDAKVSELLKQINLPADEKNIEAAKLLVKYKLPLDKEAIIKITGLQKSIDSLNQSNEGRIGLMLSGLDIKNTPVDVLNKLVLTWSSGMVKPDNGDTAVPLANNDIEAGNQAAEPPVKVRIDPEMTGDLNKTEAAGNAKEPVKVVKTAVMEASDAGSTDEPVTAKPINQSVQEIGTAIDGDKGAELLKVLNKLGIKAGNEAESFAGQISGILASMKNADMEAVTYLVSKEMDATPKNLAFLIRNIENSDGISQFLDKLQQKIGTLDNPELKEIKESIRKVFLEPRQVEHAEEVSEQLKDIAKLGERLERYLEGSGNKDPEIREALTNLRDNIDFIRSINAHNNFMQLPLMINGDTSTAKLYVFKEGKRGRQIDPENATVVVALDLTSLGHLESLIGVKNKTVNITFRVESKAIGAVIEKQSHLLKKSLEEKGYNLSPVRIINLEQPFSLLSMEAAINGGSTGRIHFDKRI